jgi:hypothetical protein
MIYLSWVRGWFCGLLHQWHPYFLKQYGGPQNHARFVLEKFWEIGLYAKLEKCEFHQFEVEFLGYIIFGDDIHMFLCKV